MRLFWFKAAATGAAIAAITSCSDVSAPRPPLVSRPRVRPEWVTGEAAAALDSATGLFRLGDPQPHWVSVATADSIALAVAHLFGSPNPLNIARSAAVQDRGAPIDFDHLSICERSRYVFSPFGKFPLELPGYARRAWGAHWPIFLCGRDGTAQLSIGVPDGPMDIEVANGALVWLRAHGGGSDFSGAGVPPRFPFGWPVTPEEAVAAIYKITSRRIQTVPTAFNQLDDRGFGQLPLCGSWRLSLESPVSVRSKNTGVVTASREFFVRRFPACYSDSIVVYLASANQPTTWPLLVPRDTVTNDPSDGMETIIVPLAGPVIFEPVTIVK